MGKPADKKKKKERKETRAKKMRKWREAVLKARAQWRENQRKLRKKRRFQIGTKREKHLSGYWEQIMDLAREIYGGPHP
jgi:hypothetical protein